MATSRWQTIGEYLLSFDLRTDASRFILIRKLGPSDSVVIARGLIDGWPETYVLPDEQTLPDGASLEIVRLWEQARQQLLDAMSR